MFGLGDRLTQAAGYLKIAQSILFDELLFGDLRKPQNFRHESLMEHSITAALERFVVFCMKTTCIRFAAAYRGPLRVMRFFGIQIGTSLAEI